METEHLAAGGGFLLSHLPDRWFVSQHETNVLKSLSLSLSPLVHSTLRELFVATSSKQHFNDIIGEDVCCVCNVCSHQLYCHIYFTLVVLITITIIITTVSVR